ncbi:MAG: pilus assembly protein PilM [Candidatus Taylorbacteria bacterium]
MPRMGLDISSHSVRFMEMQRTKNGLRPGRYGERKIPEGASYSEEVQTNKELKEALISLKQEYKLKFVNVSLPEEKAYLFQTALPALNESDIRGSIELSLEENVPISGAEAVFDYSVIEEVSSKENAKTEKGIAVSVIPRKVVEGFSELFGSLGLVPLSFELAAEAIARAIVPRGDGKTYMIVNLGEKKTGIYVVCKGIVFFTTTLSFGGEALTSGIEKLFNVSNEEAIKIKKGKDFIKTKENMKLFFSLLNPISSLRDEINRLYIYWNTHKNQKGEENPPIQKIILCGADSNLHGFDEYLAITLKIECEVANVWTNLFSFEEYIPELSFADSLNYPTAIGLAMVS